MTYLTLSPSPIWCKDVIESICSLCICVSACYALSVLHALMVVLFTHRLVWDVEAVSLCCFCPQSQCNGLDWQRVSKYIVASSESSLRFFDNLELTQLTGTSSLYDLVAHFSAPETLRGRQLMDTYFLPVKIVESCELFFCSRHWSVNGSILIAYFLVVEKSPEDTRVAPSLF